MADNTVIMSGIGLTKQFRSGDLTVDALRGVDVTISRGEVVAIIGPSGSGKSTLMGILGGLKVSTLPRWAKTSWRRYVTDSLDLFSNSST
jgi:putative ABC transport system ATP-binding protein